MQQHMCLATWTQVTRFLRISMNHLFPCVGNLLNPNVRISQPMPTKAFSLKRRCKWMLCARRQQANGGSVSGGSGPCPAPGRPPGPAFARAVWPARHAAQGACGHARPGSPAEGSSWGSPTSRGPSHWGRHPWIGRAAGSTRPQQAAVSAHAPNAAPKLRYVHFRRLHI